MSSFQRLRFTSIAAGLLLLGATAWCQEGTTPAQGDQPDFANMSREERIKVHEERVKTIIEERRKQKIQEEAERNRREQEGRTSDMLQEQGIEHPQIQQEQAPRPVGTVILFVNFFNQDTGAPELDTVIRQGTNFLSEINLQNESSTEFDRVCVALKFDKRFLKPLKIFDSELRPFVKGEPRFEVIDRDGILVYEATMKEPRSPKEMPVLKIVWEAVKQTDFTALQFRFSDDEEQKQPNTGVYLGTKNILGREDDPIDGVLNGSILVLKPFSATGTDRPEILQGKKEELRNIFMGSAGAQARAGIQLKGPKEAPVVGEEFDVNVVLNNPSGAVIDSLRFFVKFDPDVFEVVDNDKGNWIKQGTNVLDGPYRHEYPFDYHKQNTADNRRGHVQYSMACGESLSLPTGTFATIKMRAKSPSAGSKIELISSRQGAANLTSIQNFGFELMTTDKRLTRPEFNTAVLPGAEGEDKPAVAEAAPPKRTSQAKE